MLCEELELREVLVVRLPPVVPRLLREVEGVALPREGVRPVVSEPERLLPRVFTPRGATYELPRRVGLL